MPELHEPVLTTHRAPDLDDRLDRVRSSASAFLSAFLGGVVDQGRRSDLPVVQYPSKVT
jgi:hypothetical protein